VLRITAIWHAVNGKYPDDAVKMGAIQIRLDARLLGDRWKLSSQEILSPGCPLCQMPSVIMSLLLIVTPSPRQKPHPRSG